MRTIFL